MALFFVPTFPNSVIELIFLMLRLLFSFQKMQDAFFVFFLLNVFNLIVLIGVAFFQQSILSLFLSCFCNALPEYICRSLPSKMLCAQDGFLSKTGS